MIHQYWASRGSQWDILFGLQYRKQFTDLLSDDWENIYTWSWNNGMRCMSFCILISLWYGRIASWDIRVLVVFAPNLAPVTDMQRYYHARYPTDDWCLAYMFSLVYFSVEVCLVGVFPHSLSTRRDPASGSMHPSMHPPPPPPPPPHTHTHIYVYIYTHTSTHQHSWERKFELLTGIEHIWMFAEYLVEVCLTCC